MLSTLLTYGGSAAGGAIVWHFLSALWTVIKTRASADITDLQSRVTALETALKNPTAAATATKTS